MIGVLVQARMGSRRLPGKVTREIGGRPLLAHLLDSLRRAETPDALVVTTSQTPADDRVAELCREEAVACFRGPLDDVSLRMFRAAEHHGLDVVVRVSGDSPLLDPRLVDRGVSLFLDSDADLVTNVFPRSFPRGQSVEVFPAALLGRVRDSASAEQLEHVTTRLYRAPERYRIVNFSHEPSLAEVRMSVDTPDDADRIDRLIRSLPAPPWEYELDELVQRWIALDV